jgi:hypothetical protein
MNVVLALSGTPIRTAPMSDDFSFDVFLRHCAEDKAVVHDIGDRHENNAPRT